MNEQNKAHTNSVSAPSFQKKFESIIDALDREGVTFDNSTIDYFKKLLHEQFSTEEKTSESRPESTGTPKVPSLKELKDHGVDLSDFYSEETGNEPQPVIDAHPASDETEMALFDLELEKEGSTNNEKEMRELLTSRLRNHTFIVGAGAWQQHWEKKKKPGMAARMDEIEDYNTAINKPLEPSHDDLKSTIPPELLKRFSTKIIVMKPMTKRDYLELIPSFAETLPLVARGLFTKLATEQVGRAHKDLLGMRFFEEILTQTLTADMAMPLYDKNSPPTQPAKARPLSPPKPAKSDDNDDWDDLSNDNIPF